jgi:uncharacterized protein YggE
VIPDLGRMTLRVESTVVDKTKALNDVEQKLAKVVEAARGAGVAPADIQTSQAELVPV